MLPADKSGNNQRNLLTRLEMERLQFCNRTAKKFYRRPLAPSRCKRASRTTLTSVELNRILVGLFAFGREQYTSALFRAKWVY